MTKRLSKRKLKRTIQHPQTKGVEQDTYFKISLRHNVDSGKYCLKKGEQRERADFANTVYVLCRMTWQQLRQEKRHGYGWEKISKNAIRSEIPKLVTEDITLIAFRYSQKRPMVGFRGHDNVFYPIWFDRDFTLYEHG